MSQRCKTCELCGQHFFAYDSMEATKKWADHIANRECPGNTDPDMELKDD